MRLKPSMPSPRTSSKLKSTAKKTPATSETLEEESQSVSREETTVSQNTEQPLTIPPHVLLGAHTSTAGGICKAIERAKQCNFTAAQIFVKNNKQWFSPPLSTTEIKEFNSASIQAKVAIFAHNSYLINLASPKDEIFFKSIDAMKAELERAESLNLPFLVMHPGSHTKSGEVAGLQRITKGLDEIISQTAGFRCRMALEITAGQGDCLGHRLEHLLTLLDGVKEPSRLGVCLDTAHLHAAGYTLSERSGWERTMSEIENVVGVEQVLGWHFNDTPVELGGRVDRHTHLGEGKIGLDCFGWILADPRWAKIPKVLETPKSEDMHEDIANIRKLASYLQIRQ